MGGFRKAMPFTFVVLRRRRPRARRASRRSRASSPRTRSCSSWRARAAGTGSSTSLGYVGAFLTAIYTWRMIFRAFFGEPVARGARARGRPPAPRPSRRNPADGEVEDTDVGFPGPEHHIAERALPMKVAMGMLAVARDRSAASLQIPNVDDVARHVPRADVRGLDGLTPSRVNGLLAVGLVARRGARPARASSSPTGSGCSGRARRARMQASASAACTGSSSTSGTSTSSSTPRSSGPSRWFGRFGQQTFERVFVNGHARRRHHRARPRRLGRRARRAVRLPARLRRAAALRRRRRRPLLPASSAPDPPLSILLWLPARRRGARPLCCSARRSRRGRARRSARCSRSPSRSSDRRLRPAAAACSTSPTRCGSASSASTTSSASTG